MQLFSGDELVFIGPGSEWFWTTVGSIVTAVSLIAIFRQLRLQRSADAIEQVDSFMREFFSERLLRHQLTVLHALRDGVEPAQVPSGSAAAIANYLDTIGSLAHKGHLDAKVLDSASQLCQAWWVTLAPLVRRVRVATGMPTMMGHFEWLTGRFAENSRRLGATVVFDDKYLTSSLARRIALTEDMLHVEQELRTVIVASFAAKSGPSRTEPPSESVASSASSEG